MSPSPSSPPPVPLSKTAKDQRALNQSAGVVTAAPKSKSTSHKRLQSNANEPANKHNKTETTDLDDTTMDAVIDAEEKNKRWRKRKQRKLGEKAKTRIYLFYYYFLFDYIYHL